MSAAGAQGRRPEHGQVWKVSDRGVLVHVLDVVPTRLVHTTLNFEDTVVWRTLRMQGKPMVSSTVLDSFLLDFEYVGEYDPDAERRGEESFRVPGQGYRASQTPGWDEYFLGLAQAASVRGKCTRRKVGALVVGPDRRIMSVGYNGAPSGMPDCLEGGCPRGRATYEQVAGLSSYDVPGSPGACVANHAETNALLHAGRDTRGATLYVNHEPCMACTRTMAGAGVVRVVWPGHEADPAERLAQMLETTEGRR